jgi:hypothetical protein
MGEGESERRRPEHTAAGRRLTGVDEGEARVARSDIDDRFNTRAKRDAVTGGSQVGGWHRQVGPASASMPLIGGPHCNLFSNMRITAEIELSPGK